MSKQLVFWQRARLVALIAFILAVLFAVCATLGYTAVGDAVGNCTSVSASGSLNVQPSAGVEWIIHNIWFSDNVEVDFTNGTQTATALQFVGPDWQNFTPAVHVSNTNYMVVKNLNVSTAKTVCYDGTVTK